MAYDMYGNPIMQYQNPMINAQQRLNMLQQQQQMQYNQQMQGLLKGRQVSNFDEVKSAMVDLDGTPNYFIDNANKKIYVKQIGLDGSAMYDVYEKVAANTSQKPPDMPVMHSEIEDIINSILDKTFSRELSRASGKEVNNVQSYADDDANVNAKVSKQSNVSKSAANGSRKE